ncbi:hypothetical protein QAD02_020428 [Eretmocerus hayati]|uniref:Uncharacterized protein n=1 Tax=Eretmocerus hayati TaxID=131215 RepID=A0ACC2PMH7_9HYME|nr:hypothetical protein QAD02_020428 [Eretmocerus hayati]
MHTFLDYEKNDLFNVLNSSKKGRILLKRYANDQYLVIGDLKDIVVYHYMNENYEITTPGFSVMKENTLKLFPCQANQVVYEAPGGGVGPRGYYYNHYRTIRSKARLAGDLSSREPGESESNDNEDCDEEAEGVLCLTNSNRAAYKKEDVIRAWDDHYPERLELLVGNKKKRRPRVSVEEYFGSFKCSDQLMLILLLEGDFKSHLQLLAKTHKILQDKIDSYDWLFVDTWLSLSKKIVKHLQSSKSVDILKFHMDYRELIASGTTDSLLALFLILLSPGVPKKVKVDGAAENVSKGDLSRCFILHVEDPTKRSQKQEDYETWLRKRNQEIVPYSIFCGKVPNVEASICVNSHLYTYTNRLEAVQVCDKCLTALQRFPNLAEFAWSYIDLAEYKSDFKSINSNVKKFGAKIESVKIVDSERITHATNDLNQGILNLSCH